MPRYQVSIQAEKLPRGLFRRPNPYAVVIVTGGPREGENIGKTETVYNTVEPDFTKVLFVETDPSVNLPLKISIYNYRNETLLAEATFEATEVFVSPGHYKVQQAENGAK
jgi:C2 domain